MEHFYEQRFNINNYSVKFMQVTGKISVDSSLTTIVTFCNKTLTLIKQQKIGPFQRQFADDVIFANQN